MYTLIFIFAVNFSLLLLHEMDAVRNKEWKIFIILKDIKDEDAYIIFSLIHLPLYIWIIISVSQTLSTGCIFIWILTDIFMLFHGIIHFLFRKHASNNFKSLYSNALIYGMCILSAVHLFFYILW